MTEVYFTDLTTKPGIGLLKKLEILLSRAGIERVSHKGHFTAVKIHFGEYGNLAFIRPNFVRIVIDKLKSVGAKPFVTDANTLYRGSRSNAVDHLWTATMNGFTSEIIGAPIIIADGLRGSDEVEIEINGNYIKKAKISSAIAMADSLVVITHFKGHEQTGFGGTIKNVGMGSASRAGKLEQHTTSKPYVKTDKCIGCGFCVKNCPVNAITLVNHIAMIDYDKCLGCGQCIAMCNYGAMLPRWDESNDILSRKMVEYAKAVLKDKPALFISFITQVSPDCDCWSINRPPIAPDIGIAVSTDPVALDQACIDLVLERTGHDPFLEVHPGVSWREQLEYAEKLGLGSREYKLEKVNVNL
ncbi:DUF362 domain-containing protein [Kosmotoga pacifica]|uniref:4Fe-4S ferredoxin n=1 Tax=Kosmotoga pacifica TaxID=1330330 RepID=A0A0G2ZAZ1_9BACT|nr:DUF362 domain-containing protein [Kosmotoga pacifica]AKI97266.1 4Fe-4S ferredoxin [Kosmotoga pacifica]